MVSATNELASSSLGYENGLIGKLSDSPPCNFEGSCVALIGDEDSIQIGIGATQSDCRELARRLFGMEEGEEGELSEADVADAMGEMANVIAGGVKVRVANDNSMSMNIGLPIILQGHIVIPNNCEIAETTMQWQDVAVRLLLLRTNGARMKQ